MKLAMVSHVPPVPSTAGQRQRVRHTLEALREEFAVTFITSWANLNEFPEIEEHADEVRAVGSPPPSVPRRAVNAARGSMIAAKRGLKRSNHDIGRMFSAEALAAAIDPAEYDLAVFHYWHAVDAVPIFRAAGTRCVLDMHDILSRARASQLSDRRMIPAFWIRRQERLYSEAEEAAWRCFDGIVAINEHEQSIARQVVDAHIPVWYAPMGVHLDRWPYAPRRVVPQRLAYYGGLNSPSREAAVLQCVGEVMPAVWERFPECEFWVVGANPGPKLVRLGMDPRVHVTGFLDDPSRVLASTWALLCPFSGKFGFRSRLIEVMACGVPVIANPDAVHGMGLREDESLMLGDSNEDLVDSCIAVLADGEKSMLRGELARAQAERFGFAATYGQLASHLATFAQERPRGRTDSTEEPESDARSIAAANASEPDR